MNIAKSLWAVLTVVSVCLAQTYNISGIVTDTGTTPLPGAVVKLEKAGLTATSGADGRFTLAGTAGIHSTPGRSGLQRPAVTLRNGLISFNLREPAVVRVDVYSVQGRLLSMVQKTMGAGTSTMLCDPIHAGVYIYRVKIGENDVVLKGTSVGDNKTGSSFQVDRVSGNKSEARTAAAINEVIAVTKDGFLNYQVVVYNSDTSNIQIKMIVCADTVRDIDGNLYQAVRIGNQIWTVENLRVTRFNDGSAIQMAKDNATWRTLATPGYCYYKNTTIADSIKKFGALYNWYTVNMKNLTPVGWHVPSDVEWDTLQIYLMQSGYNWDGTKSETKEIMDSLNKIAKSMAAKTDWWTTSITGTIGNDLTKNNRSGFSALPGGGCGVNDSFQGIGTFGFWWTSTEAGTSVGFSFYLSSALDGFEWNANGKQFGFSIRLVKDAETVTDTGLVGKWVFSSVKIYGTVRIQSINPLLDSTMILDRVDPFSNNDDFMELFNDKTYEVSLKEPLTDTSNSTGNWSVRGNSLILTSFGNLDTTTFTTTISGDTGKFKITEYSVYKDSVTGIIFTYNYSTTYYSTKQNFLAKNGSFSTALIREEAPNKRNSFRFPQFIKTALLQKCRKR